MLELVVDATHDADHQDAPGLCSLQLKLRAGETLVFHACQSTLRAHLAASSPKEDSFRLNLRDVWLCNKNLTQG